ncbi:hypothetical protein V6N13_057036 [Hibiscus sabdariffa]
MPTPNHRHISTGLDIWSPSEEGWIKINSDGARNSSEELASCGGVLQNSVGDWLIGFTKFIKVCSIVDVELRGAYIEALYAWDLRYRQVILDLDNLDALHILNNDSYCHGGCSLVSHLTDLRQR